MRKIFKITVLNYLYVKFFVQDYFQERIESLHLISFYFFLLVICLLFLLALLSDNNDDRSVRSLSCINHNRKHRMHFEALRRAINVKKF